MVKAWKIIVSALKLSTGCPRKKFTLALLTGKLKKVNFLILSSSRSQVPSIIWIKSIPLISHLLKVVRIFTSSTFTDMLMERNTLMEYVYPKIKEYCREKHGLEYQVVDMRWGVRSIVPSDSCHV